MEREAGLIWDSELGFRNVGLEKSVVHRERKGCNRIASGNRNLGQAKEKSWV